MFSCLWVGGLQPDLEFLAFVVALDANRSHDV